MSAAPVFANKRLARQLRQALRVDGPEALAQLVASPAAVPTQRWRRWPASCLRCWKKWPRVASTTAI